MRYLLSMTMLTFCFLASAQNGSEAALLAQQQLDGYNARDIDAFLKPYSDSVKIFNHPNELQYSGKEGMRKRYTGVFERSPDLHCTLVDRMVLGNIVMDQESVIFGKGGTPVKVIVMYKVAHGKIQEVYFIEPDQK